jgi:hypothetical protein
MPADDIKLGFSTGALYKTHSTKDALRLYRELKYNVVELGFMKPEEIGGYRLDEISENDLVGFRYVSLHAPNIDYACNAETERIFKEIENINILRKLDLVVFHPDRISDFAVFENVNFNIAFENMDNRKRSFRTAEELGRVLSYNEAYKMVLDVNHVYSIDPTMKLAKDFYSQLGDRIGQIHLSGYVTGHEPLYVTKQINIIESIQNLNVPIILESVVSPQEIVREREYVINSIQ